MGSTENEKVQGGLYPTIAVSDAFQAACHIFAAKIAYDKEDAVCALGFLTVAVAGIAGVLRFGFSEAKYARANNGLADIAAFVGLPIVGLSFVQKMVNLGFGNSFFPFVILFLSTVEVLTRCLPEKSRKLSIVILNVLFFILPIAFISYLKNDMGGVGGVVLFAVAGIVITSDRHRYILQVRCENWFHYCIGIAAYFIAQAL